MLTSDRIILLMLGALNVGCGTLLLAAGDYLPQPVRIGAVVVQAMVAFVLAQSHSWNSVGPGAPPH